MGDHMASSSLQCLANVSARRELGLSLQWSLLGGDQTAKGAVVLNLLRKEVVAHSDLSPMFHSLGGSGTLVVL
jgi:hypothetical protein